MPIDQRPAATVVPEIAGRDVLTGMPPGARALTVWGNVLELDPPELALWSSSDPRLVIG